MTKFDTALTAAALAAAMSVPILASAATVPAALAAGSCSTFALLGLAHVALWPWRDRMPRPASYVVGVSCAGVGTTLISILLDAQQATISAWLILIAFVAVFAPGGLLITAAWWLRASGVMPADKLSRRSEAAHALLRELDNRRN